MLGSHVVTELVLVNPLDFIDKLVQVLLDLALLFGVLVGNLGVVLPRSPRRLLLRIARQKPVKLWR